MPKLRVMLAGLIAALVLTTAASADQPVGGALVEALRSGGYVIYFRHAATNWSQQDRLETAGDWTSCDPERMRQVSVSGRATAREIGVAIRKLGVPVSQVLSSEYCRARETAMALGLAAVRTTQEVMNLRAAAYFGGREALAERLRRKLAEPPELGTNTVIVGHGNVIRAATGVYPGEAGAGIFRPDPRSGPELIATMTPEDWKDLAERHDRPEG